MLTRIRRPRLAAALRVAARRRRARPRAESQGGGAGDRRGGDAEADGRGGGSEGIVRLVERALRVADALLHGALRLGDAGLQVAHRVVGARRRDTARARGARRLRLAPRALGRLAALPLLGRALRPLLALRALLSVGSAAWSASSSDRSVHPVVSTPAASSVERSSRTLSRGGSPAGAV